MAVWLSLLVLPGVLAFGESGAPYFVGPIIALSLAGRAPAMNAERQAPYGINHVSLNQLPSDGRAGLAVMVAVVLAFLGLAIRGLCGL